MRASTLKLHLRKGNSALAQRISLTMQLMIDFPNLPWFAMPQPFSKPTQAASNSTDAPTAPEMLAPGMALLAMEWRAFWEFGAVLPAWPVLQQAPAGDGHPVIVFPGLAAGDASTAPLRKYLSSLGYQASGWQQGNNFGPRAGVLDAIKQTVQETCEQHGRKVSLIGWSLGGIYAREIAKELPQSVRSVITLGTPFAGSPRSTHAWRLYEMVSGRSIEREADHFQLAQAPAVPTTSVYSKSDGIVAWQGSIQSAAKGLGHKQTENIEVLASHLGIGLNPSAWWAVADRLSQFEGQWRPFSKPKMLGLGSLVFP